jgi:hypothetical protein
VQLSDVPDLAHTRPHAMHWLATATVMVGVVGLAGLLQPGAAAPRSGQGVATSTTRDHSPLPAPGTAGVDFPLECGGVGSVVTEKASGDLDGDGDPETVAVVRCDGGSGTPPSAVYVLTRAAGSAGGATATRGSTGTGSGSSAAPPPRIVATLVTPQDKESVGDGFGIKGGVVLATLLGYSTPDVPRCCPDEKQRVSWQWKGGAFVRSDLADGRSV